ncbi:MAG: methyltransferase domain-containing protein [Gemmatimonadetes bacterium]|nr:methyltransferase domain-containing protein [Gemmatimonadota bacterium]
MSSSPDSRVPGRDAPSMLDLVRLSPRPLFPPGGEPLYRQIAVLTGMDEGTEVLDVGCGTAVTLEYFVREYGVHGSGIEADGSLVASALERMREREMGGRVQVQEAPADRLPYRDEIFDVTVGEVGMTASATPEDAVRELVRVTRPGGTVVLVQLVWRAPVEAHRRTVLAGHLGVRPRMLVEWKRLLRENGVADLHTEDWTDPHTAFRPEGVKPFPDFAELFSLGEKIGILRRAWARWGWTGVRTVLAREREVHKLLTRERILGLDLLKGVKRAPVPTPPDSPPADAKAAPEGADDAAAVEDESEAEPPDTQGLPLFSPEST